MSHVLEVSRKGEWWIIHKTTGRPGKKWRQHQWLYLTRPEVDDLMRQLCERVDAADVRAAREARARIEAGEPLIPWEQVKAELEDL